MGAQKHFNLILSYETYLALRKEAIKRDCSVASLIRQGVNNILENPKRECPGSLSDAK